MEDDVSGVSDGFDAGSDYSDDASICSDIENSGSSASSCTQSRGFDFEVISEERLLSFQFEMEELITWFKSDPNKKTWPKGLTKDAFRKRAKFYKFNYKKNVLYRIKRKKGVSEYAIFSRQSI